MHLLLPLLLATAPVWGDEPEAPTPPAPTTALPALAPDRALQDAIDRYLLGEHEPARAAFEALVQRSDRAGDVPPEIARRAMTFLAEMAWVAGDLAGAEAIVRTLLGRDPEYRPSEADHVPELLELFDLLRADVARVPAAPPVPMAPTALPPYPWWGFAPLGVPQFKQRRPVRGAVYAVLQVGLSATNVAGWIWLDRLNADIGDTTAPPSVRNQARDRAHLVRDAMVIPSAAAAYATWVGSVIDGSLTWRRSQLAAPAVTLLPSQGGAVVAVAGSF